MMRKIWLFSLLWCLGLALLACSPEPEKLGTARATDWLTEYVSYIQETMETDNIPGLALALVQGDEIILAEGYGLRDVASQSPVTAETLFHIGSTQKSMTAMLLATLADEGLLDWDEPIINFAPEFALSAARATEKVTLRQLLGMSSGIPDAAEDALPEESTPEDLFAVIRETSLLGMPGEEFSYSNLAAAASGYLGVLAADGESDNLYASYADLLQERVLDPIGMETATLYASVAQKNANHSQSYTLSRQGDPILSASYDFDGDILAPAGSLKANVTEMALYVATQLSRGVAPNGNRVVSAENLAKTWQPHLENYGLGWEIQEYHGSKLIFHTGAYDDFVSVIGFLPEFEVGFVILVNSEEAGENLVEAAPYVLVEKLGRQ